jgi:aminomethyltransferase
MKYSPLDASHRALGAKITEFGGWEMPLSYPEGTLAEHNECRHGAAMFDVSHLGTVRVEGVDAFERLQNVLTNDLAKIRPGRAQYTHLLDEADASVVDDIIVWWIHENRFDLRQSNLHFPTTLCTYRNENCSQVGSGGIADVEGCVWHSGSRGAGAPATG